MVSKLHKKDKDGLIEDLKFFKLTSDKLLRAQTPVRLEQMQQFSTLSPHYTNSLYFAKTGENLRLLNE